MIAETFGFRLRFLGFFGPQVEPATVTFGAGLNVLYGASDTGKSFVVEAIDFMLGGKPPLRDLPERSGYDRIMLGLESLSGDTFSLLRSIDGGSFRLYTELLTELPTDDVASKVLSEIHSDKPDTSLSGFLLGLSGLAGKRIRKNARGDTNSLSFRNLARLMLVTETEITKQRTPLSDGNAVADTANFSTFRMLLTGVDDSALIPSKSQESEEVSREAQLQLLEQMLGEYRDRLNELSKKPKELSEQLEKIDNSLRQHALQVNTTEEKFQEAAGKRREMRRKLEESRERRIEIGAMVERFGLLDKHYESDVNRLRAIEESGTLFNIMGSVQCPLCGAAPTHQWAEVDCDGNIDVVVEAARKDIAKIEILRGELASTVEQLNREGANFDRSIPNIIRDLQVISDSVDELIAPKLSTLRKSYSEHADKRSEVREALALYATVQDMERRKDELEKFVEIEKNAVHASAEISTTVTHGFAKTIENILKAWHFPSAADIYFDAKARDIVLGGKSRIAFGKGLRAVTHSAFTLGLLAHCRSNRTPHPGIVVLDSPLLAYREPEGSEDDLTGTDLQERFYAYLQELAVDTQVIIVENTDPPEVIRNHHQSVMFGKNPYHGRYGLFPNKSIDLPSS